MSGLWCNRGFALLLLAAGLAAGAGVRAGEARAAADIDANITQPVPALERLFASDTMRIVSAEISRPKAKGDITLRADVSFGEAAPLRVKVRRAEPGAEVFNNVPRYDLGAYELQKLFLDPAEYVVPPTALRMMPLVDFTAHAPGAARTFSGAEQLLVVVQYWLSDVSVQEDIYDPARFASDARYARHIGQLNLLTYLIGHSDSNLGNFMIGRQKTGPRVFSVDNGVAFASERSDRGELWRELRVSRLPADSIARLREVSLQTLSARLGVLAQWKLDGGMYVPVAPGANLDAARGVRRKGDQLQMGLTRGEIRKVFDLLQSALKKVDRGSITLASAPEA
jgi:hypothetical protein